MASRATPRALSSILLTLALVALFPAEPAAVPPEVTGQAIGSDGVMRWDFVSGATGFNIYSTTRARAAAGDYGDCLVGSHRTTSLADLPSPGAGEVLMFLVTVFDETGEGTAGFRSDLTERFPSDPCEPARRYFAFSANGDPGDGVFDGVEPFRNAMASTDETGGEITGVYLHSGEFFLSATDLWSTGRNGRGLTSPRFVISAAPGEMGGDGGSIPLTPGSGWGVAGAGGLDIAAVPRFSKARIAIPNLIEARKGGYELHSGEFFLSASRILASMGNPIGVTSPRFFVSAAPGAPGGMSGDGGSIPLTPGSGWGVAGAGGLDIAATPRFSKAAIAIPNLIEARKGGYELHSSEFFLSATDLWSTGRNGRGLTSPSLAINLPDSAPAEMSASGGSIPLASGSGWGVAGAAGLDIAATPRISKAAIAIPNLIEARKGGYEPAAIEAPGSIVSTVRSYRSQIDYNGPLGHGWDFGANARVVPEVGDIRVYDGRGRADLFVRTGPTTFNSPPGIYKVLIQNPDASFTLRDPDGTLRDFHRFNGSNLEGALARVADRNGNFTSLLYDHQGLLKTIVDTMGRSTHYAYDAMGRITAITDFAGRQVQYSYDAAGNLASVRSPVVTGTPNGNDFPAGKLTTYRYSSGFADERLNHNLTGIVRPNEAASGAAALQISYGTGTEGFDLDRVTAETIGGTNATGIPAGGSLSFTYESLNPGQPPDPVTPRRRATVLDRNGNQKEFVHNHAGNILVRTDFTNRGLRPGEGNYTTLYSYSTEGERLESVLPAGNRIQFTYDSASPNRGSHGNLLEIRAVPDNPGAAGGRGDGHGNAAAERVWTFTYDDFFNGLLSATDPRGNDPAYVPQNGGTQSAARYTAKLSYDLQEGDPATNGINALSMRFGITPRTTPLGLGDLNGDGRTDLAGGNPVRLERPAVLLDPASNQAAIGGDTSQEIVTLYEWNDLGQPTAVTDPEGNRHQYAHWPETDPDGDGVMFPPPDDGRVLNPTTGGYLKTVRYDTIASPGRDNGTDPTPTMIQHDFEYDDVGNVTGFIDGRGVLTRYIVNSLNQVVEVRRAAATADLSGPDGDPPTGRGETSDILPRTVPVGFKTRYSYDANDNLVRVEVEDRGATRGVGPFLDTTFAYDILDDLLSVSREATPVTSLVTQFRYDANENRVQVMQPEGNAHSSSWDERDLLLSRITGASGPRAGVPASRSYEYDGNGNLVRLTDARGGLVDFAHDGFDRLARRTDQVGNTGDYSYDPAGMVVRSLRRGPVGGPTPADRSGSTNVDLADARLLYDELGRLFRIDRALFVPTGATPARAPILAEGPGIPADGFINSVFEYDRLSRLSFSHRDSAATTRYDYDGAGRVLRTTLPQGVEVLQATYDAGHNLVETVERELALTGAGASIEEQFLTTAFYDALNRREIVFDNLGQTRRAVYDSLDAVVAASDARGPAGGTINRRSPGNQGISVPVNAHGNITRFGYDGAGRLLTATRVLTTTGEGDGTLAPPPDDGNVFNPDGLVTLTTLWDGNSLPAKGLDDRGNETIYAYDNLNRLVLRTGDDGTMNLYGLDPQGNLVSLTDPNGSEFAYSYDAAHRRVGVEVTPAAGIPGTTEQTFQYDGLDRLTRATDNNSPSVPGDDVTILFTYDSLSRLVEEGQAGGLLAPLRTTDYGWRAEDLMTDRIYPDGRRIGYQYDAADRLVLVDDVDDIRPEQMTYDYFGLDRVHTRTSAAGVRSTRLNDAGNADVGFDGARRTTLLRHLTQAGTLLAGFEFRYDREDNPKSHRRLHHADAAGNRKGETYAYDSAGRLMAFEEGFMDADHLLQPPPDDSIDWMLDGASNWPEMTRNGVTYLATPNNMNDYGEPRAGGPADDGVPDDFHDDAATANPDGLNLANDANLNLTFDGRHTLFFDPFDRLVSAVRPSDGAQIASYTYDALGRRVTRVVNNSGALDESRRYYSSGAGVLEERDGTGAVARQIVTGHTGPLWQILPGGVTHYLLEDPPGSTVALFAAGARGGIVERATYDPYGKPLFESAANAPLVDGDGKFLPQSQYTNTHLFIGMWYEPELGARADNPNDDWGGLYLPRRDSAGLESTLDANSLDAIVAPTGDPAWGPPEFTALALAHRYDPNKGRGHPKKGATSSVPK